MLRPFPPDRSVGWVPFVWLIYLVNLFLDPAVRGAGAFEWGVTAAATVVFLVAYFRGLWVTGRDLHVVIAVELVLAVGFILGFVNCGASVFFVYAASAAARLEPPRRAFGTIAFITVLGLALGLLVPAPAWYWVFAGLLSPLIGAVCWQYEQGQRGNARLRLAQEEVARLAAVAERERIARDLHDVVGHTLTLIVLKSELASKLADRDPVRAAREIREVEQVSRQALGEVRAAITGYRATWDDEVARARVLLETAVVRCDVTGRPEAVDRATEETLALAVREAVTNVVRHANASACHVRFERQGDRGRLEVIDDGTGGALREGNGLRGLRERVEALGGSVEVGPAPRSRGHRLAISVPLAATGA